MSVTCDYDSGTMTGCRPLCDRPAEYVGTYSNGTTPAVARVCADHRRPTEDRAYPSRVVWAPIPLADRVPDGEQLAGNVSYAHGSGAYVVTTRGGTVSGRAPSWGVLAADLAGRHGYRVIGDPDVTRIPSAGETITHAYLSELDWSRCPA